MKTCFECSLRSKLNFKPSVSRLTATGTVFGARTFLTAFLCANHRANCRCFPHVINLAVQAIYATLKDSSNADLQLLLGNLPELTEEVLQAMPLPDGVTVEEYRTALATDILGMARKLVTAC